MTSLSDVVTYSFSELADGTYKAKETDFVEETHIRQMTSPILILKRIVAPETEVTTQSLEK